MKEKLALMIPGPTPVPERVLKALSQHPIGHRTPEFQEIVKKTTQLLQWLHQTEGDVLTITGSGTAAMEAGIINTLKKGDKVICGENGKFGERWVKIAKAYGLNVEIIKSNWGEPLEPEKFRNILQADNEIRAVILTHSETSTGVINNLEAISKEVRKHEKAITIADCVTSLGACNVPMDEWGIDVLASGSQKGYMMPPGLSFVAMNQRAWKASERSDLPSFYLNLKSYKKTSDKNSNPFTPSVNLYFALEEALNMMKEEGLEKIFSRHNRHKEATQKAMEAIGLKLFAAPGYGSPSITAVEPKDIDADLIRKVVKENFDILLAGGQDHLKGKVFRIGHLGFVNDRDIITAIASIESALNQLGALKEPIGTGVATASKILFKENRV
ncbi:pyridoxal-phosphate-dependent aminotransferase family protein [Prochlorococcus marinus]|uniref:Soluble hydrogenase small subunit n=1 Tax=Prochlorococcus marinus (strain MIT 9211) TaxID=93059 RepID=A9B9J1_PROM4|nr:alanine--glyoxylate aminotransferase family protein [Prochlorococcus marinus]ABX07966.1 soluble hydrogenase small subunit [Prochlorococcus marinus str. MIT 9211]